MRLVRWWSLLLVVQTSATCLGSVVPPGLGDLSQSAMAARERQVWATPMRDSHYAAMQRSPARASCEASKAPEPLATPNPLLAVAEPNTRVTVSFIIGTDGRVYSPLILESAGPAQDRTILDTVRGWRYRPATCNGAATETESKIEFSSR